MDLERVKQLRNEYADQRIVSNEQLERLKKVYHRHEHQSEILNFKTITYEQKRTNRKSNTFL